MELGKGFARKACAAGLALVTTMALVPGVALASDLNGNTGKITVSGVANGDTVTIYQILDRNYDEGTNTVKDRWFDEDGSTLKMEDFCNTTSDGSTFSANSDMQKKADKIAAAITSGKENALDSDSKTVGESGTVDFGEKPAGEWLILVTGTNGTTKVYQNTIVSNAPEADATTKEYAAHDANVTVKSTDETIHKGVGTTEDDAAAGKDVDGAYGVGDLVPFVISTSIPQYPADSSKATFMIADAPTKGLAIDEGTVKVSVGGDQVNAGTETYTLSVQGGKMTVDFVGGYILKNPGQKVLVTYKAKVTKDAFVTTDGTTSNSASIKFNTNPYQESSSEPSSTVKVKTYGLFFAKQDVDGNNLKGATFQIKYNSGDKKGQFVKDESGKNLESTSDENGAIWFDGLAKGEYTLVETKAPAGFQTVNQDVTIDGTGADDNPYTKETEVNYMKVNGGKIIDSKVGLLPTTGAAGTIGLTAVGICLVAGSAIVVSTRGARKDG